MSLSLVDVAGSRKIRKTFDVSFTFGKNKKKLINDITYQQLEFNPIKAGSEAV